MDLAYLAAGGSWSTSGPDDPLTAGLPSRPELLDAPQYMLEVELHFPNLAPITGRSVQPVPLTQVSNLTIGLPLACAVDPADPSHRFVVDWANVADWSTSSAVFVTCAPFAPQP
jgi:hypothetical protein